MHNALLFDIADEEAGVTAAVKHFSACVLRINGLAQDTLETAAERGQQNQQYGDVAKASLNQLNLLSRTSTSCTEASSSSTRSLRTTSQTR